MARVKLYGWLPGSDKYWLYLIKALVDCLHCPITEALNIYGECVRQGRTVVRDNVPLADARKLEEELRPLAFRISVSE